MVITGTALLLGALGVIAGGTAAYLAPKAVEGIKNITEKVIDEVKDNTGNEKVESTAEEKESDPLRYNYYNQVKEENLGNQEPQEPQDEEKPTLIPPIENGIKDETNTNIEQSIGNFAEIEQLKALRNEQWAREDELTKKLWEREDTAWQRTVADMQKAGVNPNLVGASATSTSQPVQSSTGIDYSAYIKELDKQIELLKQELEQDFDKGENWKDRIFSSIEQIMGTFGYLMLAKGLGSKQFK